MPNKIFDITPPQIPPEIPPERPPQKHGSKPKLPSQSLKSGHKPFKPIIFGVAAAIIAMGALCWFFIEPKLKIEIWPVTETKDFKTQAVVLQSKKAGSIPGEVFKIDKSLSQDFSATGFKSKEEKAHGTIRVFNNYSTNSQTLIATTRFISADGKLFRTPQKVVIPGGHYEGTKLVSGTIDIEVMADQPGPDYNINPSTFVLPGLSGTPKYTAFYAKSFEPMSGGIKKQVPQVTKEDIDKAQQILTAKILEESKISLENLIPPEDYILLEKAAEQKLVEFKPSVEVSQETGTFTCEAKSLAQALVFKKSEMEAFAKNFILSQLPPQKEVNQSSYEVKYSPEKIDLIKGEITLNLEITAEIYSAFDLDNIKGMVKNKNSEEIKAALKDFSEIDRARVELWPFWVSKSPQDSQRIEIELKL